MIYFTLPNFYITNNINLKLIDILLERPEISKFNEIPIRFIGEDGNFPFFYWSGDKKTKENYDYAIYPKLNDISGQTGLKITFDCSNPLLSSEDFFDATQNVLLKLNENGSNEILLSNPDFLQYIKNNYPNYVFIASPFYEVYDPEFKNKNDFARFRFFPSSINKKIPKSKIELSIIENCFNCPNYQTCQLEEWNNILNFMDYCSFDNCKKDKFILLSTEEILNFYKEGISHFYIDTRTFYKYNEISFIKLYLDIFIKNEFKNEIFLYLLGEESYD